MNKKLLSAALFAAALAQSAFSWDLPSIITRLSDNCSKITTYAADAAVRYKI